MKTILPLVTDTWIQTYHIRNFELGLLQTYTPWIYSKYINCYYDPTADGRFNHCMPSGRYFESEKVFYIQKFKFDKSIYSLDFFDFIRWAEQLLGNSWYIIGYFDEYYIPVKESYRVRHFRHTMMIYGYDDQERIFFAIGYTKDRKYKPHTLTYDEYLNAIKWYVDNNSEEHKSFDIDKVEFEAIKINPKYKFIFDLKEVYISIRDYINSVNTKNRTQKNLIYGIDCENEFKNYIIISGYDDQYLDERYSRFFMELKEVMVRRLEFLAHEKVISPELVELYSEISNMQRLVHLLFLKFNLTCKTDLLDHIVDKINVIIRLEREILPKIQSEIYSFLVSRQADVYF